MPFKPSRRLAAFVLGAVAVGLAAVYVTERGAVESGGRCAAAAAKAAELKPFAKGKLSALLVADQPTDLSEIVLKTPEGAAGKLSDLGDKSFLVNLWATWCVPCRAEMPHLQALQQQRGGADFSVVALNVDIGAPEKPSRFLTDIGATALIDRRDPEMAVFNELKSKGLVFGLPTTFVVDRSGCALASLAGAADWASDEGLALVDQLVKLK